MRGRPVDLRSPLSSDNERSLKTVTQQFTAKCDSRASEYATWNWQEYTQQTRMRRLCPGSPRLSSRIVAARDRIKVGSARASVALADGGAKLSRLPGVAQRHYARICQCGKVTSIAHYSRDCLRDGTEKAAVSPLRCAALRCHMLARSAGRHKRDVNWKYLPSRRSPMVIFLSSIAMRISPM